MLDCVQGLIYELHPDRHRIVIGIYVDPKRDPGYDRLSRVELIVRSGHGLDDLLPDRVIDTAETPRDLLLPVSRA